MEKLILNISKKGKISSLLEILKSLDYIDSVVMNNKKKSLKKRKRNITKANETNFFKLAGIWKNRNIDLKKIREKAWRTLKSDTL